jgi:RNA polymerase sigma-70 factor (ECF subfamily)
VNQDFLAGQFEEHRVRLRAVAYRMLGSFAEADDAVQETWLRLSRTGGDEIDNLGGWLTTVVGRVCLNLLRSRETRREVHVPDPVIAPAEGLDPEQEALVADSVGLALLVVLDTLEPAERLAFVLHDMFALPFDAIAPIVGRTPTAARQLASRARRRVQGVQPDADLPRQWAVVDAFMAAARGGDFEALVALLDPDVVLRVDSSVDGLIRGAETVARRALLFSRVAVAARPMLVNGAAGMVSQRADGTTLGLMAMTIRAGRIAEIDIVADPERLAQLT